MGNGSDRWYAPRDTCDRKLLSWSAFTIFHHHSATSSHNCMVAKHRCLDPAFIWSLHSKIGCPGPSSIKRAHKICKAGINFGIEGEISFRFGTGTLASPRAERGVRRRWRGPARNSHIPPFHLRFTPRDPTPLPLFPVNLDRTQLSNLIQRSHTPRICVSFLP